MSDPNEPTSTKPYLLRALYEWCVDNGYTAHVSVVVDARTRVPVQYVRDGAIVLNIGPLATNRLKMGNEWIEFSARFNGAVQDLLIPVDRVAAIYARENGQGMSFVVEPDETVVDDATAPAAAGASVADGEREEPGVSGVPGGSNESNGPSEPQPPASPAGGGRPSLRVVK